MQKIVTSNVETQLKLALVNYRLEKILILAKVLILGIIIAIELPTINSRQTKLMRKELERPLIDKDSRTTQSNLATMKDELKKVSYIVSGYRFRVSYVQMSQYILTNDALACSDFGCIQSLSIKGQVFDSSLSVNDTSGCLQSDCDEFKAIKQTFSADTLLYFGRKPSIYFQLSETPTIGKNLDSVVESIVTSGWVSDRTHQLQADFLFQNIDNSNFYCLMRNQWGFTGDLESHEGMMLHFFYYSPATQIFSIILLVILLVSLAKPLIESSVTHSKWLYFTSIYLKIGWITFAILVIISQLTESIYLSSSPKSPDRFKTIIQLDWAKAFLLHILLVSLPFEFLKVFKKSTFLQGFFRILSTVYGAAMSMVHYTGMIFFIYCFVVFGVYGYFAEHISSSLPVFMLTFLTDDIQLGSVPLVDKAFYSLATLARYILWVYFLVIAIFYCKLVATHVFQEFEPRYFKSIIEKLTGINKEIENFSNDVLLKPMMTAKSKNRRIIIWLNATRQQQDGWKMAYSNHLLKLFDDISKKGIGISFFNEFREVISFMKSIYNIMPKIIMSTTKSVRIVVYTNLLGKADRIDQELQLIAELSELNQFISKMGLDTEILSFEETHQNIRKSIVYSFFESTPSRVKITNKMANLSRFCQMMPIEDFFQGGEPEEDFNNILSGIEDQP